MNSSARRRSHRSLRGLTLTELLVVVLIIGAILAVAVPSFSSLLYSSEAAMAESQVQAAMRGGRDAALRASSREDAALVFLYDPAPGGGRMVLTPCVKVADFYDLPTNLPGASLREIFVPSSTIEPVQMPRGWMVRGYAPANSIDAIWYEGNRYGQNLRRGDWVFPETGFYTPGAPGEGRFRHTFMVRFQAGSGVIATQIGSAVLVFSPSRVEPPAFAGLSAGEAAELRALRLGDPRRYVERVVASNTITPTSKLNLLGVDSPDMVTVKPVNAIAVYDEIRLASALRARIDPDTGCLYKRPVTNQPPTFVPTSVVGGAMSDDDRQSGVAMNQWIEGDTDLANGIESREDGDAPQARLFTIDRYTGALKRAETQP